MHIHKILCFSFIMLLLTAPLSAKIKPLEELEDEVLVKKISHDCMLIGIYRNGLLSVMNFVRTETAFNNRKEEKSRETIPDRDERELIRNTWKSLIDHYMALGSLEEYYQKFSGVKNDKLKKDSFSVFYSSFLMQYRFALEFIGEMGQYPNFDVILNENMPELGLPERIYDKFKLEFLNVKKASQFAALYVIYKFFGESELDKTIKKDEKAIWNAGKGKGEILTVKNAFDIIGNIGMTVWMPVQQGVSTWMGNTRMRRGGEALISQEQISEILPDLQPGDILLQRREWYMSNIGLPGFWMHAALFIGSPEERRKFFRTDEVREWVKEQGQKDGDFEALLKSRYPAAYELGIELQEEGHIPCVLEAIGEGVSFTTIEHSAAADSMGVLRPKLTRKEKAVAILRAFHYSGRPYDFNFDFLTDAKLVCSELIYKAYEPAEDYKGIKFPLDRIMGRPLLSPNEICHIFDDETNTDNSSQMDFVLFLDGIEKQNRAVKADADEFRVSWKRPKWHIIIQE